MDSMVRRVVVHRDGRGGGRRRRSSRSWPRPDLQLAFVFADWRLDRDDDRADDRSAGSAAPVVGGTTLGVIGRGAPPDDGGVVALGLYGDWLRVGLGVAPELPKSALTRSRDAVNRAAAALGTHARAASTRPATSGSRSSMGRCGHEEAFCIGSAAAAPQIRFVGGCAADGDRDRQPRGRSGPTARC